MMTTLLAATTTPKVKRGRPRVPDRQLKPRGERARRDRAKVLLKELAAAGRDPPPELLELAWPRKRGRPRLSDDVITLPEYAGARRKRDYRAQIEQQQSAAQEAEVASALLALEGSPGTEAAAEALAAKLQARQRREAHKLDSLAADGTDFDGPAHTGRIRAFVREDDAGDAVRVRDLHGRPGRPERCGAPDEVLRGGDVRVVPRRVVWAQGAARGSGV